MDCPMSTVDNKLSIRLPNNATTKRRRAALQISTGPKVQDRWRLALARADGFELPLVRRLAATARFGWVRSAAMVINFLGNGWIYVPIAAALLLSDTANADVIAASALMGTAIGHGFYAVLKHYLARPRPFDTDRNLRSIGKVMDRNSFPSGHCMTLTAVLLPILQREPGYWPVAVMALGILAWSRLVAAHHYLSDIVAGIVLGGCVALPVAHWLLAV